jgi:hypothetical protein
MNETRSFLLNLGKALGGGSLAGLVIAGVLLYPDEATALVGMLLLLAAVLLLDTLKNWRLVFTGDTSEGTSHPMETLGEFLASLLEDFACD